MVHSTQAEWPRLPPPRPIMWYDRTASCAAASSIDRAGRHEQRGFPAAGMGVSCGRCAREFWHAGRGSRYDCRGRRELPLNVCSTVRNCCCRARHPADWPVPRLATTCGQLHGSRTDRVRVRSVVICLHRSARYSGFVYVTRRVLSATAVRRPRRWIDVGGANLKCWRD